MSDQQSATIRVRTIIDTGEVYIHLKDIVSAIGEIRRADPTVEPLAYLQFMLDRARAEIYDHRN